MRAKRSEKREYRRLPVEFWVDGDSKARAGFSVNLSSGGMFIGAGRVFPVGTLLHIRLTREGESFEMDGRVVHAMRRSPLQRLGQRPGMGVRFLQPIDDLNRLLGS